jgi:hypothetical protein
LENALNYETGIFGTGDTVWYTSSSSNLKYKPYSILNGTYEKIGDYCTASAKVEKVEGWVNIFISLPINPIAPA